MSAEAPPRPRGAFLYKAFLACSALTCAVGVAFFAIGIGDGSVSSFNIVLWLGLLATMGLSLFGGISLRARGRLGPAIAVLAFTAIPGLVAALFILLVLVTQPRWN